MVTTGKLPQFLIREAQKKDVNALIALSHTPGMFNMPSSPEAMRERIEISRRSFHFEETHFDRTKYVFVAEDLRTGKVIATSMIAGQHGTEESPHHFFKVGTERRFSSAIQTGFIHGTLTLKTQTNGPSELGALVVEQDYRSHPQRVGRQIFLSRFLFLAKHKNCFREEILAELLPPLNKRGHAPLWEAVGRRFTNLDYWEADALSAQNKDFIFDLFPQGKIYTTFLPADARNSIGKVGKDTEPVLHMLKRMGFKYHNEIDPFDGGPHLRAKVNEIIPVKKAVKLKLKPGKKEMETTLSGLITPARKMDGFLAVGVTGELSQNFFTLAKDHDFTRIKKLLKLKSEEPVLFLPFY